MNKTTDYRQQAQECLQLARQTTAPHHRASLLQIAETWFALAEERDRGIALGVGGVAVERADQAS